MNYLQNMTLLIVEDNAKAQEQLGHLLKGYVRELYQAYDGAEALEAYEKHQPDMILSDIRMPVLDGLEMARKIRETNLQLPIMFLSAHAEPEMLLAAVNIPVDGYLTKPIVDLDHLLIALERMAQKAHQTQALVEEKVQQAVREAQAKIQTLKQRSAFDHLTRIPNRLSFLTQLEESIKGARQAHSGVALFYIDLDHLKQINDQYGHQVGDHAIKKVVNNIHDAIGSKDFFARIGGDEFALIVETKNGYTDLIRIAKKILTAASLPIYFSKMDLQLSCSIGISRYPQDTQEINELIHLADQAMYQAKRSGKNGYRFFGEREEV